MIDLQTVLTYLTLISVPVGVLYHIMTLNNTRKTQQMQLETRQAQLFMQIYAEQIKRNNIPGFDAVQHMEFKNPQEFEDKYGRDNNPEAWYDFWHYSSYYEGIGVLVREKFVDIRLVALLNGGDVISSWEKFEEVTYHYRDKYNWPRWSIEWEYLYKEMKEYANKHQELQIIQN